MGSEQDDVAALLEAARAAAQRPTMAQDQPDPVEALLSTAVQLTHERSKDRPRPRSQANRREANPSAGRSAALPAAPRRRPPTGVLVVGALVVLAALLFGAYLLGASSGSGTTATAATNAPDSGPIAVDQAKVTALMAKVASNPKDTESLQTIGNIYYDANDFAKALTFYEKVVAVTATNDGSWIAVAAAAYQSGNQARALEAWNKALGINPNNIEAHYGLGHYYAEQTPPDPAKAKAEWEKVVAIDPTSPLAKEVQASLARLTPTPAASTQPAP